jgi:hypothetical protein
MANYTVRILNFKCVDESGFDFLGSDEPCWMFTARDNGGNSNTCRSKEFSNVDSGDVINFQTDNNRNVVWPKKGAAAGAPGPIGLSIQLWDIDQGNPDDIERKTERAFDLGSQVPVVGEWVRRVPSIVRDQISNFIGNDLMGSKTLLFPEARLRRRLPNVGSKFTQRHRLGGNSGDLPIEIAGGPDYDLFIEVQRVS